MAAVSLIADREVIHRFFDGVRTVVESLQISADDKRLALTARKDKRDLRLNINGRLVYAVSRIEADFRWRFMLREADLKQLAPSYVVEAHRRFAGPDGMFLYEVLASQLTNEAYEQLFLLCLDACTEYLPTQNGSPYRSSHQPELYEMALDPALRDEVLVQSMEEPKDAAHLFEHFIAVYKDLIRQDHNEPERYKWVCTQTFQEAWDLEAPDFEAMLKAALRDRDNLLYHSSASFILLAARYFPQKVRQMFRNLFDEAKDLNKRLQAFVKAAEALQGQVQQAHGKPLKHLQDERTISFYLAMRFPEKYPLYKPDIYDLLLRTVIQNPNAAFTTERRKTGERLGHFLELGTELLPLITADEELQTLVADTLTDDCWKGPQHWLIFQDILWRNREPVAPQLPAPMPKAYEIPEPEMQVAEESEGYAQSTQKLDSLNTILYGPPGTGKTYATIEAAVRRAEPGFTPKGNTEADLRVSYRKRYEALVQEERIQFITFHQSLSYEDFIEGIKPEETQTGDEFISYRVQAGLFKKIAEKASEQKSAANFEEAYQQFIADVSEAGSIALKTPVHKRSFLVKINSKGSSVAIPQTETATEMTLTQELIKDYILNGIIRDWKPYTVAISNYIRERYNVQVETIDNTRKNFVLIIDEINRGNVSQIFGELITLLEEDKRAGAREALEVILPYSKKPFSVPANLYVIGTMNTADRSVEALDTALRRRFSFMEMSPQEDLITGSVEISGKSYTFSGILRAINARMEVLAGRDHKIGHSYFLDLGDDWKAYLRVFTEKIIPLLQEYFYGDYSRMCLVLGTGFVSVPQSNPSRTLFAKLPPNSAAGDQLSALSEKEIWALTDWTDATEEQFSAALDTLLNQ